MTLDAKLRRKEPIKKKRDELKIMFRKRYWLFSCELSATEWRVHNIRYGGFWDVGLWNGQFMTSYYMWLTIVVVGRDSAEGSNTMLVESSFADGLDADSSSRINKT
jgi:hypothetical protein